MVISLYKWHHRVQHVRFSGQQWAQIHEIIKFTSCYGGLKCLKNYILNWWYSKSQRYIFFGVFDGAILFRMCELVVQVDVRFTKFARFHHVTPLWIFKRPERGLDRPRQFDKDRTFTDHPHMPQTNRDCIRSARQERQRLYLLKIINTTNYFYRKKLFDPPKN